MESFFSGTLRNSYSDPWNKNSKHLDRTILKSNDNKFQSSGKLDVFYWSNETRGLWSARVTGVRSNRQFLAIEKFPIVRERLVTGH